MKKVFSAYNQPKALYPLFMTELWERFGFYTQQTILILYMTKALKLTDYHANYLYAAYSSLLYLTPTIGGYVADRYLGFKWAIILGGFLLLLGYTLTAFPSSSLFFLGLAVLICANGLFKPNVSSIVGELYAPSDPRREGGFTLFYMGINIGAMIPPIFAGTLVNKYGWHTGFIFAAIGMGISLLTFYLSRKSLAPYGNIPRISPLQNKKKVQFNSLFVIALIISISLFLIAFHHPQTVSFIVEAAAVVIILFTLRLMLKESRVQRNKMLASLILILISVVFWALYNQTFTSLTLFADRNMTHQFLGINLDAEAMQFFNPFFIIALSPILSFLWVYLNKRQKNPSIPTKFACGVLLVALGFVVLAISTRYFVVDGMNSPAWLIFSYLLQTFGELLLSPIGLSMITLLSPPRLVGMMMGVWFFSQAAAFALSGTLANLAAVPENVSPMHTMPFYHHAFFLFGAITLTFSIICFSIIPFLKKMINEEQLAS